MCVSSSGLVDAVSSPLPPGQIIGTPYEFPSHHICIREPFDYYQMANAYIGSLVEFDRSILRYPERWTAIKAGVHSGFSDLGYIHLTVCP